MNKFNSPAWTRIGVVLVAFVLSACGGGGGDGGASPPASSAEGVYVGTASSGVTVNALVLEDGSFWDLYGVESGNVLLVQGVSNGNSTANAGVFAASISDFPAPGNSVINGQINGNYVSGTSLNGTITSSAGTVTFTLTAPTQPTYNYNIPANITSISGAWSGGLLDGGTATISIAANGSLTGTTPLGCTFSGNVTPRPSGKNVFNVSLTFGGAPCVVAANLSVSGIGLTYPLGGGVNQLIVGLINPSRTLATAFFAIR